METRDHRSSEVKWDTLTSGLDLGRRVKAIIPLLMMVNEYVNTCMSMDIYCCLV